MRAPLRVAIVDDHPLTEPGLRTMLSAHPGRIRLIQVRDDARPVAIVGSETGSCFFDPADAIQWATRRGSRSGRVAWQYVVDLAGRAGVAVD